ncbi:MAG TPA: HupE/UreJ family protein [Candidatus Kapabacteria bacterium]|nr:HupE/UreJ family protein [Candidatus Kapabacteria bacterium]
MRNSTPPKTLARIAWTAPTLALAAAAAAQAHPFHSSQPAIIAGAMHPFTGLDHLLAMIAVGIWASQMGGRSRWMVPLAFVSVMALGGMLGAAGVALPFVEQGIIGSVLILGVVIAAAVRLPLIASVAIVGLMALAHGYAHGAEIPAGTAAGAYAVGFILATAALHCAGIVAASFLERRAGVALVRWSGAAILAAGCWLAFA